MKNIPLKFNAFFILLILLVTSGSVIGQGTVTLNAASSGSALNSVASGAGAGQFNCGAAFTDGAGNYLNSASPYTITLCAAPGQYLSIVFSSVDIARGGTGNTDVFRYNLGFGNINIPDDIGGGGSNPATFTIESAVGGCITFTLTTNNDGGSGPNALSANPGFAGTISCIAPPANDNPCGALPMSIFSACNSTTVSNIGAQNTSGIPAPTCGIYGGSDVWYSATVPSDGNLVLSFSQGTGTMTDAQAAVYSSSNGTCSGAFTQLACDDDSGPGLMPAITISNISLAGQTIWIRLWDFNGDFEGTFDVCATGNIGTCTPTTNDCAGTMPLCSDAPVSNLASGQGCVADLNASNDGCLAGEHNTSWFLVQISSGGTWGWNGVFDVSSNGIEYDWALWQVSGNPLSNPGICSSLSTPIRCSYASQTGKSEVAMGMNAAELPETSENASPSGNGYVGWLTNALPGEYYLLMIDRWSTIGGSFTIDFTGSASMNCAITALPIELLSFKGEKQGIENILYWSTASEINNDFFTIERSNNMQEWEVVGTVDGSGTSQEKLDYSLVDRKPFSDVTYYRLRQTDFDGKNKLSYTISIVNTIESDGLFTDLFPNPTNGNFYFNYSGINSTIPIEVEIYNNLGKLINTLTIEEYSKYQSISINTENLANGVYQILLKQGSYTELRRIAIIR
jgi:hypothetical protein